MLVTGAAGGVGSVATAILAKLGYTVAASTGRPETHDYLKSLGAASIIDRASIATPSGKPLDPERWAGCIDSVGGSTLATILPQLKYRGAVASCGLAGGTKLETTVIPFLLRGVSLLGIDSVCLPDRRAHAGLGPAGARPAGCQARRDDPDGRPRRPSPAWAPTFWRARSAAASSSTSIVNSNNSNG